MNSKVEEAIEDARQFLDQRREYLAPFDEAKATYIDRINVARRDVGRLPDHVMSPHMREFICEILTRAKDDLPRQRGKYAKGVFALRDFTILKAIQYLWETRRLSPTRNAATRDKAGIESGSSIVATALERLGINMSERNIEEIWGNRRAIEDICK